MGKSQREKGKRMERHVAATMRQLLGDARREWQCDGRGEPDVSAGPFAIECKHCAAPPSAFRVIKQAEGQAPKGKIPIAWMRRQGGEEVIVMRPDDWLEMAGEWWALKNR